MNRRRRIVQGQWAALAIYGVWWLFALAFTFTAAPLICSTMELVCKAIFGFKFVPMLGYPAVCACEPVAWVICMVFILAAAYAFRNDFKDTQEAQA